MFFCAPAPGGGGGAGGASDDDQGGAARHQQQQQVVTRVFADGDDFRATCAALGGTLPADPSLWAALPHLQRLVLDSTRLSGTVPEALAAHTALNQLWLQGTQVDAAQ
eukprot:SAG31_NODE_10185_length_1173_cov_2.070764_2_plen_107_part_01